MAGLESLVTHIYTADPSAHVFEGRVYVYPSHDVDTGAPETADGDQFDMRDYHVLSMDRVGGSVTDHDPALINIYLSEEAYRQTVTMDYGPEYRRGFLLNCVRNSQGQGDYARSEVIMWAQKEGPFSHLEGQQVSL